jgi:large subunit ribosomal protein L7/L12
MTEKVLKLIEDVKVLTVLELAELVKALEVEFGVSSAAPMAMMAGPSASAAPVVVVEEQTEFNVILKEAGTEKIKVIKTVREVTSLGLKEAKDVVEGVPSIIKEGISKDDANAIAAKFRDVGATVEIK